MVMGKGSREEEIEDEGTEKKEGDCLGGECETFCGAFISAGKSSFRNGVHFLQLGKGWV